MDKKFSMMGPDGLPVEFDDYGGLSKMFKDARFKKGSSRAAPAPNYSQSYQGAQKQPATGTSAPGYDYTYRDKAPGFEGGYRPYPKPWAPPPPQLPDQASDTARNVVRRGFFGSINPRQATGTQLGEIIGSWSNPSQDQFINSLPFASQREQQQGTKELLMETMPRLINPPQTSGGTAYLGGSRNFDESTGTYKPGTGPAYQNPYSGPVISDGGNYVQQPPQGMLQLPEYPIQQPSPDMAMYPAVMVPDGRGGMINYSDWAYRQQKMPSGSVYASKLLGK